MLHLHCEICRIRSGFIDELRERRLAQSEGERIGERAHEWAGETSRAHRLSKTLRMHPNVL